MHSASTLLADLAIVLGMAAITAVVFRRLRQPVVLGYILAGLIVGPYVPVPLFADAERVHTLSELGVVLVMFGIGLEFSVRRMLRLLPRAGVVAALQIGSMLWLGYLAATLLGWPLYDRIFTGAALCISSTMIVAKLFDEQRIRDRRSELVYSVLIFQDFVAVVLIAILTALGTGAGTRGLPASAVAGTVVKLAAFLLVMIALGFLVVPRLVRSVARLRSDETLLVVCVGLCFALSELALAAGFSVALGAFLAGSLVAESGEGQRVQRLVRPLRDVFAAIFFVAVGMSVDPAALAMAPGSVALLVVVVVCGQVLSVSVGAFLAGHDVRTAVQAGTTLAQVGEFSFIIAGVGVTTGAVGPTLFPVVVAVSAVTTFLTPWLVRAGHPLALFIDRKLPHALQTYATLYGTWLENLRSSGHRQSLGALVRRGWLWLALDSLLLAGVVVGGALVLPRIELMLGLPHWLAILTVVVACGLMATPFARGILRLSRQIGTVLARAALPFAPGGRADFAAAPRRALLVTLRLAVALSVLVPLLALTQPFVPALASTSLVGVLLLALGVVFWRGTVELAEHARAGAEVIAEVLAREAGPERHHDEASALEELQTVQELLPGLGTLVEVRIESDASAVGQTLRDLDLRGLTGATVMAIGREEERIVTPDAHDPLRAGDVLCLTGTQPALAAARLLLERRADAKAESLPHPLG